MKSCFAGWNPSELGWNLRYATSNEIKSASITPALAGFHHMCIPLAVYCVIRRVSPTNSKFHPRSGFIPTKADLVKKDCNFVSKLQSFFGRSTRKWDTSFYNKNNSRICSWRSQLTLLGWGRDSSPQGGVSVVKRSATLFRAIPSRRLKTTKHKET